MRPNSGRPAPRIGPHKQTLVHAVGTAGIEHFDGAAEQGRVVGTCLIVVSLNRRVGCFAARG